MIGAAYNIAERTISYYKNGYDLGNALCAPACLARLAWPLTAHTCRHRL